MNAHVPANHALARRLADAIEGEVLFDRASRGRYATDASFYQIEPVGVIVPRTLADVRAALEIAREEGVSLLPRGGGTSQSGQTVGRSLVIDYSKHLNRIVTSDREAATCVVEPGIVLDELNRQLKATGLWFPVDVSTSSRATIGGMTGNNSCGTRSLRYGIMRDNVLAIDAVLPDGTPMAFGELAAPPQAGRVPEPHPLVRRLIDLGQREAAHIKTAFPAVSRRVGGYLIDALVPTNRPLNLATLLCGSEGTLALSERITLKLSPQPRNKGLGICHFPAFRQAMEAAQHIVKLGPVALEVVDRTLIELARDIAMFRPVMDTYVRGQPDALLLAEFAEDDQAENVRRLQRLDELMGDLGLPGSVVQVTDAAGQRAVWEVRASGLNIMMSMKSEGKPVSFIEDCAVPLEHLADYTERLTAVFAKHGTRGTWYAHASVGCLHVRPVLNLKLEKDVKAMRAIAEAAFALVREYKGSHSGEHGDGLVRSEFHEAMYGRHTVQLFEEVKDGFDPAGTMNPGKIVRPPRMDDRALFRFAPGYHATPIKPALDWSAFTGGAGGLQGAAEMCNNNGECRKLQGGVMCPSYRVTGDEQHVTRGRANTLRLAVSGQLGADALGSDDMLAAMQLCVGCKGCRRECPTGVDMARMKIEVLAAARKRHGLSLRDRLVAYLPRYAPYAAWAAPLLNLRNRVPALAAAAEPLTGFSRHRKLPQWRRSTGLRWASRIEGPGVVLLGDTFNAAFEPENLQDAAAVLERLGYRVIVPEAGGRRPLCCGRTFLAAGLVEEARAELRRLLRALKPHLPRSVAVVGLEPSCLLTLRDEALALGLGRDAEELSAKAVLFEEFLAAEADAGRIKGPIGRLEARALLHGHCHQKAFGAMPSVTKALGLVDGLTVETVESSCCGMAGAFGYGTETYQTSMQMAELSLLPAVRAAPAPSLIIADGFSCRHQIADGAGRAAVHAARILRTAMG
ncbi:MAG TPA: FAD-linked oxidase C-terminal domain-containing protein [Hyphomicrobiaceae bacterium]|nr:FAD-linked oxidase C-terminal domain-containing protein [Hyphomicrobiaceae bacterium]